MNRHGHPPTWNESCPRSWYRGIVAALMVISGLGLSGCSESIDTEYGRRRGIGATESVNGTAVLGRMFEQAGHKVTTSRWLSPSVGDRADVIVWFPNDFSPPSEEARAWLEAWLVEEPGRVVIYVGRDYDGAVAYWSHLLDSASGSDAGEMNRRLTDALDDFRIFRTMQTSTEDCDWFVLDPTLKMRDVRTLEGDEAWLDDVDPQQVEIRLYGRIEPAEWAEVLLKSQDDVLVSRQTFGDSDLIVVANGSFLLNFALVNHEHRKLAADVVKAAGDAPREIVFLESGFTGVPVYDEEPELNPPNPFEFFGVWPLSPVFLHLAALGVILCFSRLPIFGLAREPRSSHWTDFGQHVEALGEMLSKTHDRDYALSRLEAYRHHVRDETSRARPSRVIPAVKSSTSSPR